MFMKKLIAVALSVGIISTCCMSAFAGTISGVGRTAGGDGVTGSLSINYSITTKYDSTRQKPVVITAMEFQNHFPSTTTCSVSSKTYITPPNPTYPPLAISASKTGGYYTGQGGTYRCSCIAENAAPDITIKTVSTFNYNSPQHGSFYTTLEKPGWDW